MKLSIKFCIKQLLFKNLDDFVQSYKGLIPENCKKKKKIKNTLFDAILDI